MNKHTIYSSGKPALNAVDYTRQRGLSLIELMVSMVIGLVLIAGAFYVYANTRSAFGTNSAISAMQDNARFVLAVLEPEIQLAGFWGNHHATGAVGGDADELNSAGTVLAVANQCGDNWVVEIDEEVGATNNEEPNLPCFPVARYKENTDVLWLRRAGTTPIDSLNLVDGQLYVRSSESPRSVIFMGDNQPSDLPPTAQNFRMHAQLYYVSDYSLGDAGNNDGLPALRRLDLVESGGNAAMVDNEIVTGVENFHLQLGVDLNPGAPDNSVDVYVNADNPILAGPNVEVRAIRVWLLMRSDRPETGHTDDVSYLLGDEQIPAANDGFRRLVVSRTILIRNSNL